MKNKAVYTDLLRVTYDVVKNEKLRAQFMDIMRRERGCFAEVIFFFHETHDICSLSHVKEAADTLRPLIAELKSLGYRAGIDVLSTVGHHEECRDESVGGMKFQEDAAGNINRGRLCPTDEGNLRYMEEMYRICAQTGADIVYMDDDVDYGTGDCRCPHCLALFEERFGDFSANGLQVSGKNFDALFYAQEEGVRAPVRRHWAQFTEETTENVTARVCAAVRAVSPDAALGYMSCLENKSAAFADKILPLLGEHPYWRPGGGLYSDERILRATDKACAIAEQIRHLPAGVEIQSEIQNYLFQTYKKSAFYTGYESLVYILAGCTGVSFNFLMAGVPDLSEVVPYFLLANEIRPFGKLAAEMFGYDKPEGVAYYTNDAIASETAWSENFRNYEQIQVGIPFAFSDEKARVFLLTKLQIALMTDEELKSVLGKAVYMDVPAAQALRERGFGKYVGFKAEQSFMKGVKERGTDCFSGEEVYEKNVCLEFSANGHSEFGKSGAVYSIVKTDENAAYLTDLVDYRGNFKGRASGIFENELGGRVYVGGYAPFGYCMSASAMRHIKNIYRFLSGDRMPAEVLSPCRIQLWCRNGGGHTKIGFASLSLDALKDVEIEVLGGGEEMTAWLAEKGSVRAIPCKRIAVRGGHSVYRLPEIAPFGIGILTDKEMAK